MKYKAVLFDLDGTLLNSVPVILKTAKEVFLAMGIPHDASELRNTIGIPLRVQAKMFAGERSHEFIELYRTFYRGHLGEDSHLFPHTLDMLNALKSDGYSTALVTSKSARSAIGAIEATGMTGKFDVIVTADDVGHPKPSAEPILKALKALELRPEEAIYVGDSMFDVDAAQRAAVTMVAVSWGARSKEDLLLECPERVFDSWQEFLDWIDASVSVVKK